ncbi:MAG: tetratricopeptide repeat protein [Nitrospira sp.]|nr:tetratricopeptide repeat protein [Nitrospira sp.]
MQKLLAMEEQRKGPEHPDTAASLYFLAVLYHHTRAYDQAEPLYQRALTIREKVLGPEHPDTAQLLNHLAALYGAMGAYSKAETLVHRALAINEKVLGAEHPNTAASLYVMAELYLATGSYGQAEPLVQRVLEINEKVEGPEHPSTATLLEQLATLYHHTGAYAQAEPLYQRALAIREKVLGPEHPDTATSLSHLVGLYRDTGAYAQAVPLSHRALTIQEKVLGPEHPATATSLNKIADLYRLTGAYAQAESFYQRALAIREKVLGSEHPETSTSLNNLAMLYKTMGAYVKAEALYQRALAITEKVLGPDHPDTATSLNNLADMYQDTGTYANAELLYQRVIAILERALGPDHPDMAKALGNLASLYAETGAHAKAEPLLRRALAITEKVLGPDHPGTATSLNNLARLYQDTGAYGKAAPLLHRGLAIFEKALGPEHPNTAAVIGNQAGLYLATGAYTKAEPLYQRALAIREKALGAEHPDTAVALGNLASLYWTEKNLTRVVSLLSQAQSVEEKNLSTYFLGGSESRKQAYLAQRIGTSFQNVSFSLLMPDRQARELGLQSVLMTKGRVLDAMSESIARLRASVTPEDRAIVEELITVAQQRSTLTYQGIGNLKPEVYHQRLQELVARQEQLETDLSTRSAEFRQQRAPTTLSAVQAAIPNGTVLIEWYRYHPFDPKAQNIQSRWGKPRYIAYLLATHSEPVAVDVGEAESIEQLINDFRTGLSDPTSTYVHEVAKELYDALIKPLQQHLGNSGQLLISPDGALNLVPFAALRDEKGEYLGAKKGITYLTSGRDLLRFESRTVAKPDMVLVANPDYGPSTALVTGVDTSLQPTRSLELDRGGLIFRPLSGTAEEANALKGLLKISDDHVLTQTKATEEQFKQFHQPRLLHIATHGFFLKDNEIPAARLGRVGVSQDSTPVPIGESPLLRSGLALAGANQRRSGEKDDGILTAAEVAQIDLRGTQLVVLSACETGVGDVQNGEGVYGLRRALVLAGAESQVTSLWKVADEATKDLMVDYYQRLLKGEGRSEALRNAQLAMMKSKDRSHPYYWAAFVPIGNWTPLAKSH